MLTHKTIAVDTKQTHSTQINPELRSLVRRDDDDLTWQLVWIDSQGQLRIQGITAQRFVYLCVGAPSHPSLCLNEK